MIKLPEPDTHCFDDDSGKDVWSHSHDQLKQYGRDSLEEAAKVCEKQDGVHDAIYAAAIRALIKEIPE